MRVFLCISVVAVLSAIAWLYSPYQEYQSGLERRTVEVGQETREYLVYVPLGVRVPAPLVIVFHGGGGPWGSAELMYELSGWREVADSKGFIVVFGQGTLQDAQRPENLASTTEGRNIRSWSDGSNITPASRQGIDDVQYVRHVLVDVTSRYRIDPKRIYATGFSNGATFTYYLGVGLSDALAAIAPVSGLLYTGEPLQAPVSLLAISGSVDDIPGSAIAPQLVSDPVTRWAQYLACESGTSEREALTCPAGAVMRHVVDGLGHEYPDAIAPLIWDFFEHNPKATTSR